MSLSKQLGFGFFCVLLLVFIGTLWTNVSNTKNFVEQQLSSHAQDTATSLGLSITPYIANSEDLVIIETMTNAIFDRGYYLAIELKDLDNNSLLLKQNPQLLESVPNWFVNLFHIQAPAASTEINDGWNIKGTLVVVSNPGFGYQQLWNNAVSSFWVTLIVFVLALLFVWLLVKNVITHPINAVIHQTEAISKKQFDQITDVPKTPELRSFVEAINYMSGKLMQLFKQLSEQSEKYRVIAYTDLLTQVGNRRSFELAFSRILRNEQDHPQGHLIIVRASSLAEVHRELGGELGDNYLKSVCDISNKICASHFEHYTLYRIAGADFALIIESASDTQIKPLAKDLALGFKRKEKSEHKQGMAHIGITEFSFNNELKDVLEQADSALALASTNEQNWEMASSLSVTHSNEVWREKINGILQAGTSDFAAQPIVNKQQELLYSEWFARLPNEQSSASMPMAQLIPASIRLDFAQDLDKLIVENLIAHLASTSTTIGLNLSRMSLFDEAFMSWLITKLQNAGANCSKLIIEIPERALIQDISSLVMQMDKLKALGVKIAVEHFGAQLAGIAHLRQLQPNYLKLDGRFTRNIHKEIDNQLFLQSLISIAQGLNIEVIAEMIETEQEHAWLLNAGVDYMQGYFVAAPRSILQ